MEDRKPLQTVNGSYGSNHLEQLDKRIQQLEQEIPVYSNKAAEAMVQGMEDNTYRLETEKRLEELNRLKEERRKLRPDTLIGAETLTPRQSQSHLSPALPTPALNSPAVPTMPGMAQTGAATAGQPQMRGPGQPVISRKQQAIANAEARLKAVPQQEIFFSCLSYLEYEDLISMACVSKLWKNRMRKTQMWRRTVHNLETTLLGHVGKITAIAMYETFLVTGSADGKVKFWEPAKNFQCVKTLNITPSPAHRYLHPKIREMRNEATLLPDGEEEFAEYPLAVTSLLTIDKCVVIGAEDGRFIVWMGSAPERKEFEFAIHRKAITCMVVGSSGEDFIYTGSLDGTIAAITRRAHPFQVTATPAWPSPLFGSKKHETGVMAVAVAGGYFFSGAADGKIYVWHPRTIEFKKVLSGSRAGLNGQQLVTEHTDRITAMVGINDRLYTASWDCTIKLWNARLLECIRDVPLMPIGICWSLALRRDTMFRNQQLTLVGGIRDADVCIFDTETLEIVSTCEQNNWAYRLDRHTHWVKSIMSIPDGRIITGSDDWTVKVWQVRGWTSQSRNAYFAGLPAGQVSREDLELIIARFFRKPGQPLQSMPANFIEQIQASKASYDRAMQEKLASYTPEQLAKHEMEMKTASAAWAKYRERARAMMSAAQSGNVAAAAGGSATPAASVDGASATPGQSNAANATPLASATPGDSVATSAINGTPAAEPASGGEQQDASTNQATGSADPSSVPSTVKKESEENGMHPSLLGEAKQGDEKVSSPLADAPQESTGSSNNDGSLEKEGDASATSSSSAPPVADDTAQPPAGDGNASSGAPTPALPDNGESTTLPDEEINDEEESVDGPEGRVKRRKIEK